MTLLRRRAREVYRVYSEEEYLDGAGSELGTVGELDGGFVGPESKPVRERRLRRVAGVAVLAGAIGTAGGLVVLNLTRANGDGGGRRGSLVAATSSSRAVRAPAVDDAQPQVISSRAALARSAETARPRVPQVGRRSLKRPVPRRSGALNADRLFRGRGDVAVAADYVPRRSSGAASAAVTTTAPPAPAAATAPAPTTAPAQTSTTTASVAPPPAPQASDKRPEFGFER